MGINVTLNGVSYTVPQTGEGNYGPDMTNYLVAISTGLLSKAGGPFTLTAETDFGSSYGLKAAYFKGRTIPSTTGIFRLGNNESVAWRDQANSADFALKVNASDVLEYDGNPMLTIALGTAEYPLKMNSGGTAYEFAQLLNAGIAAGVDAVKIADASVSNAEFQYISGVTSAVQTQLNAKLDDVATANDNEIPRFNTNGQALQNSLVLIDDSGNIDSTAARVLKIGENNATNIELGSSGNNVVVKGNWHVEGTTTTVDSTTMVVTDPNILLNNGGDEASANSGKSGVTVTMSDATDCVIGFDSSLTSKFKAGVQGVESEIIIASGSQIMTGQKTFNNTTLFKEQASTPGTPASGYKGIYPKADGKLYSIDDAGNELEIGSGSGGSGEPNYITNPSGTTDTSDWTESTSGQVDIERTVTAGDLPRETLTGSGLSIIGTGSTGTYEYVAIPFVLDDADVSKKLKIQWAQKIISGYLAGELEVVVYDVTNTTVITPSIQAIPAATGVFTSSFDATTSQSYELRIRKPLAAVTAGIVISDVIVGPGSIVTGPSGPGPWTSFTPTWTNGGTITVESWKWRQNGESMEIQGATNWSSAGAGSALQFRIPDGKTLTSISSSSSAGGQFGTGEFYDASGGSDDYLPLFAYESSTTELGFVSQVHNGINGSELGNGDFFSIHLSVPIAEWAGSGTVNLGANDVEYASNNGTWDADDTTSFSYGTNGEEIPDSNLTTRRNKTVRFQTPIQATDRIDIEILLNGAWVPAIGAWQATGYAIEPYNTQVGLTAETSTGIGWSPVSATPTDIIVRFGRYAATLTGAGAAWSTVLSGAVRWRVVKHRSGIATSFGLATATQSGLVKKNTSVSAYSNTDQTGITSGVLTTAQINAEKHDSDGIYNTSTYKFEPTVAGKYSVSFYGCANSTTSNSIRASLISIYKNGSEYSRVTPNSHTSTAYQHQVGSSVTDIIEMNGTTDYLEFKVTVYTTTGTWVLRGAGSGIDTNFTAFRVSD